ncbi:phage tail protein, partial [Vibrio parahaemolyticus]
MANTTDKSILTAAGKALLAQLNAEEKPLIIDKMIFANVPNRPEFPQPDDVVPTDHVVHQEGVEQRGRLSADSVIYSTTLTSDVGPFEFNWTGAYCSEYGVLVTIDHHALTPKSADEPGVAGNTLVRSVVLEYKDIAEITNITVDASSWQYNATPRMKKMDDDVAQAIIDQNGKDWFIEDGFLVTPQASAFNIKAGAGYVSGNRVTLEFDRNVQVPNKPSFIYVDAHREGTPTGEQVTLFNFVVTAEEKDDYIDANGVKHFVCKIAQVLADGSVNDLRPEGESASKLFVEDNVNLSQEQISNTKIWPSKQGENAKIGDVLRYGADTLRLDGQLRTLSRVVKSGSIISDINMALRIVTFDDEDGQTLLPIGGGIDKSLVKSNSGTKERSLSEHFDDEINVKDFGVVGDGVSNDTVNLHEAIRKAISDSKSIFVPPGTYLTDYVNLNGFNGEFRCAGMNVVTFKSNSDGAMYFHVNEGSGSDDGTHPTGSEGSKIYGFSVDCRNTDTNISFYVDKFRRGEMSNINIRGGRTSFKINYSWLNTLSNIYASQFLEYGFDLDSENINADIFDVLSAYGPEGSIANFKIGVNSGRFNSLTSEGKPQEGIQIFDCKSASFVNPHIEGDENGFYLKDRYASPTIAIRDGIFWKCKKPIKMDEYVGSVEFVNNHVTINNGDKLELYLQGSRALLLNSERSHAY